MLYALVLCLFMTVCGQTPPNEFETRPPTFYQYTDLDAIKGTELVLAFVIFRHGDRTPDNEELELYPELDVQGILYPYGPKALTNRGKQRSYALGEYLRKRYDGLISRLYIPDEVVMWTTDYDRTKMSALCASAALYKPLPAQRWNPSLNWQPVPYNILPCDQIDLLYWYNCPRYLWLRDQYYEKPEVKAEIEQYKPLFRYLSEKTKTNITTPENVFFLNNLFQALRNVRLDIPEWAIQYSDQIKEMTVLEYKIEFYTKEIIRLASGVLMSEIRNVTAEFATGRETSRKLRLYSAHENNVAALMAAVGAFEPHQPPYSASFSLELRRKPDDTLGVMAVYVLDPKGKAKVLPMKGCGGQLICDLDKFLEITKDYAWTIDQYNAECPITH